MRPNPWKKMTVGKERASDYRKDGGKGEHLVGNNGEINASSRQELMKEIANLAKLVAQGEVMSNRQQRYAETSAEEKRELRETVEAAFHDRKGDAWLELGALIGAEINESGERDGFMRRLMLKGEATQGMPPRIRVRRKDTRAIAVSSDGASLQSQLLRGYYMHPPEFYVRGRISIGEIELNQGPGDLLDEKFFELQEQVLVKEDKLFLALANDVVGVENDLLYISGGFTPSALTALKGGVTEWGLPAATILMATDVQNNMLGSSAFATWFDPISQHDIVMTGEIGRVVGCSVITDAFRDQALKVLTRGDIWVFGNPENLGAYTDRGPIQTQELNTTITDARPGRGWDFHEILSLTLGNARAVAKGSLQY
jgi:hypothetical protein